MHSFLTVTRLIMMFAGVATWQRALNSLESSSDDLADLNDKFSDSFVSGSKDLAKACLWSLTVLGLVIDLLCFKWLPIAGFLFYLELLHTVVTALIPYAKGIAAS